MKNALAGATRRNFLHPNDLEGFVCFLEARGYLSEAIPENSAWEVARLRLCNPEGTHPPLIIYRKLRYQHLTVPMDALPLVREYLNQKHRRG